MNLGLGNLTTLKQQLLAEALRSGTKYDAALTTIGKGVGAMFEKQTNRKFSRVAGDTVLCSADRDHFYLPRTPVETITSVEIQTDATTGFTALTGAVLNSDLKTGLVYFGSAQGHWSASLRITFTGGYWFDDSEDASGTMPGAATALPDDLQLAWILQCRAVWQSIDKTGVDIIKTGANNQNVTGTLASLDLIPQVKEMIASYRRFQMT
jgi:hypothetical protein